MDKTQQKEKLEAKISRIADGIFALDPSRRTADDAECKTLRTKLADAAWRWATLTFGIEKVEKAGVEIMQCVNRCVTNYKGESENDAFLHYLSAALKTEITRASERNAVQESRNITLPEHKQRTLKQMIRYAESCGKDISDARTQETLAAAFGCSPEEIAELVRYDGLTKTVPAQTENTDGEEVSLLETAGVSDMNSCYDKNRDSEYKRAFGMLEEVFQKQQERTKAYTSALVTFCLLKDIERVERSHLFVADLLLPYSFVDKELLARWRSGGDIGSQKDIAARFYRKKSDASRTLGNFIKKVKVLTLNKTASMIGYL